MLEGCPGRRCDAVLVVGMALSVRERDNLDALGVAVATVGFSAGRWPAVMIDDAATVRLAAAHLAALGHRRWPTWAVSSTRGSDSPRRARG